MDVLAHTSMRVQFTSKSLAERHNITGPCAPCDCDSLLCENIVALKLDDLCLPSAMTFIDPCERDRSDCDVQCRCA